MTLTYVGTGAWLPGVPARDLTDEEVQMYGGKEALLACGLYEEEKPAKSAEKEKKSDGRS
jgi:hypothetical protein